MIDKKPTMEDVAAMPAGEEKRKAYFSVVGPAKFLPKLNKKEEEAYQWRIALLQHCRHKDYLKFNYTPEMEAELRAEFNEENRPTLQKICDWHNGGRSRKHPLADAYAEFLVDYHVHPGDWEGGLTPEVMELSRTGRSPGGRIKGLGEPWREMFHSYADVCNAPKLKFAIEGWLQAEGITMFGGLPGHGKTLVALSTVKALLTGEPLFGHAPFSVDEAKRVIYLCPESGLGPMAHRLKLFGLSEYVAEGKLLLHTLKQQTRITLTDSLLLEAMAGADVFLDTAIRFMDGEENNASEQRVFSDNLFALLSAGARSVVGLHHAPKRFEEATYMTLENALRGTNELGAMLSTAWGLKQVDPATNRLYIQNIKARDFEPGRAFVLEGRPHIDATGDFKMVNVPGLAGDLRDHIGKEKGGRPSSIDEDTGKRIEGLAAEGKSVREIAKEVGKSTTAVWRFLNVRVVPEP
jgi:AAA domain